MLNQLMLNHYELSSPNVVLFHNSKLN